MGDPRIFIANLGYENVYWPVCRGENVLTLHTSEKLFDYWKAGDRNAWLDWAMKNARMINGQLAIKPVASRWYNLLTIFHDTLNDIWVHRDKDQLYWTRTIPGSISISSIADPFGRSSSYLLLRRPTEAWKNKSTLGQPLLWRAIHQKAHDFLQTEATYQEVANERGYKDYVFALLHGLPLEKWHDEIEWQKKVGKNNPVKVFNRLENTIYEAVLRIRDTVSKADGRYVVSTAKIKNLTVPEDEFREFLKKLFDEQGGLCNLTGLKMLLNGEEGSTDFRLSVDRIDSEGHYDPKNVQLVCRFANFWKSNRDDKRFKELIQILRDSG